MMSVRKSCQSILAGEGTDDPTPAHQDIVQTNKKTPLLGPERQGLINKLKSIGGHRKSDR